MSIRVRFETRNLGRNLYRNIEATKPLLTAQILKDSNQYIPADTWALRDSSLTASNLNQGQLVWNTPYARRLYYGIGMRFSKDKNMNASAEWFNKALGVHKADWVRFAQRGIEGRS